LIKALIILVALSSCTHFLHLFDENESSDLTNTKNLLIHENLCPKSYNELNVIHHSSLVVEEFSEIAKVLQEKYRFTFPELVIAYTAYQQLTNPIANHDNARLQMYFKDKDTYFDLNEVNHLSFKDYASLIKKKFKTRALKRLEKILNDVIPRKIHMQKELHKYLLLKQKNQVGLYQKKYKKLFKLEKPLIPGERFERSKILLPNQKKFSIKRAPLFTISIKAKSSVTMQCNFDYGLYENNIYIRKKKDEASNLFALQYNEKFFIAYASTSLTQSNTIKPNKLPAPLCFIKGHRKNITMLASGSHDPFQILFNLINYEFYSAETSDELMNYISFPRHEVLTTPSRIVFESKRSTKRQLNYFLSLSLPVYHSESIGEVWTQLSQKDSHTFIPDNRKQVHQTCHNQ